MDDAMVVAWILSRRQQMVEDIRELVAIKSVGVPSDSKDHPFGKECREVLGVAATICGRQGFELENHGNYCGSFLWQGNDRKELGIFGHLDVVPAGPGWTYDPFSVHVDGDILIGRGVSDNKGAVVAVLHALEYLKISGYKPLHSIRLFLGCNEESGMKDVEYYLRSHAMPHFSFTPDVEFPVCNGEKGILNIAADFTIGDDGVLAGFWAGEAKNAVPGEAYALLRIDMERAKARLPQALLESSGPLVKIRATGIASHSAFPEGSKNAEVVLATMLLESGLLDSPATMLMQALVGLFSDYYGRGLAVPWEDEMSGQLTHVGSMVRMDSGTILQHINIRYNISADRVLLLQKIKEVLLAHGFAIKDVDDSPPSYVPADSEVVRQLTSIARRHLDLEVSAYVMGGGTYARKLHNAIGFGPGNPARKRPFGKGRGGAHQPDECVDIEDLMKAVAIYVQSIPLLDRLIAENRL